MTPTRLARGTRVGDRYRLDHELGHGADSITWEAIDERLDRPVALRIFAAGSDRRDVVARAGVAASLTHPRVVRVFDTGEDRGRFFTVSELMSGSLRAARLPITNTAALAMAIDVAEALDYAHERGVVHGHIDESNVLLSESGAKVGDFGLSPDGTTGDKESDLRQFGALLRRTTARSDPMEPSGFDRIVEGLDSGAYSSAAQVLTDLHELRPVPAGAPRTSRMPGWILIVIALLLGLAAFGVMRLGGHSPTTHELGSEPIKGTALQVTSVKDFDPQGDGREGATTVAKINDGDAATFWATERYSTAPDFSALAKPKQGVGVIFDLGKAVVVGKAQLFFVSPGCSFEIRYSDDPATPVDQWQKAADIPNSPLSAPVEFGASASARYWLLWITRLTANVPGAAGKFACGVREADLFSP